MNENNSNERAFFNFIRLWSSYIETNNVQFERALVD